MEKKKFVAKNKIGAQLDNSEYFSHCPVNRGQSPPICANTCAIWVPRNIWGGWQPCARLSPGLLAVFCFAVSMSEDEYNTVGDSSYKIIERCETGTYYVCNT